MNTLNSILSWHDEQIFEYYNLPTVSGWCLSTRQLKDPIYIFKSWGQLNAPRQRPKGKKEGILAFKPNRARTFSHQNRSDVDFNISRVEPWTLCRIYSSTSSYRSDCHQTCAKKPSMRSLPTFLRMRIIHILPVCINLMGYSILIYSCFIKLIPRFESWVYCEIWSDVPKELRY